MLIVKKLTMEDWCIHTIKKNTRNYKRNFYL